MIIVAKRFLVPGIVFALILFAGVRLNWWFDETVPKVETWLETNSELTNRIGKVRDIEVKRSTSVSGSAGSPKYKKYTFYAKGEEGNAIVRVKVSGEENFEIIVIE